jgi:hypothetical protein
MIFQGHCLSLAVFCIMTMRKVLSGNGVNRGSVCLCCLNIKAHRQIFIVYRIYKLCPFGVIYVDRLSNNKNESQSEILVSVQTIHKTTNRCCACEDLHIIRVQLDRKKYVVCDRLLYLVSEPISLKQFTY